jgi:cellulose synthase/poly-beta-1,6-N-acetylglucosamine synthase-like glycosyltransferase
MASPFAQSLRFLIRHPRKAFALPWNRLVATVGLKGLSVVQRPSPSRDPELIRRIERITSEQANAVSLAGCVASRPRVSIIIPIYGQLDVTRRCLASIQANRPQCEFEVIVVDDCSPDDSAAQIGSIPGVRLIRNPRNLGFLRSCNEAASHAHGEYLCFLNNDTEVQPRWLDALLLTFAEFPGCGLAGSKLISCDGTLQEAVLYQKT